MIWHAVEVRSTPVPFWRNVCEIDDIPDNMNSPTVETEIMLLVDNWSAKCNACHGFIAHMGTTVVVDAFVIETVIFAWTRDHMLQKRERYSGSYITSCF
jgi:hypothetical protein